MSSERIVGIMQGPFHAQIGKNGLTDGLIQQLADLLKRNGMIKVVILKAFPEEKQPSEIALEVEKRTKSFLVEVRGRTFILSKRRVPIERKKRGLKPPKNTEEGAGA